MPLTNSQFDSVMREFESRRIKNERDFRKKLSEAYKRFPRIQEIDNEIAGISLKKARISLGESGDADFDLNAAIDELSSEKKTLLEISGFKGGLALPEYDCPICGDTGFADGRKCRCFKQAEIELLYAQSRLSEVLKEENFDTFDLSLYSDTQIEPDSKRSARDIAKHAYNYAKKFADNFETEHENICLIGQTAVGKTFLSHCIAKELIDKGFSVLYLTAPELFGIFEQQTFRRSQEPDTDPKLIFECDLLIIDDLGTNINNSFVSSQLFYCINERIITKKSTIISTNLSISDLRNTYSDRITSRLNYNYQYLYLFGDDIRQKKRYKQKKGV